ncbi:hypothetical protein QQP08_009874 [Theobroma cacao]|nr:hypothetical protein QQP08_009874 [Theobroma cacao]
MSKSLSGNDPAVSGRLARKLQHNKRPLQDCKILIPDGSSTKTARKEARGSSTIVFGRKPGIGNERKPVFGYGLEFEEAFQRQAEKD